MTGNFDQSSSYGVKWSMRFSTPPSGVLSPCSPRPRMTSIYYLLQPEPPISLIFARMLHSYCNAVKHLEYTGVGVGNRGTNPSGDESVGWSGRSPVGSPTRGLRESLLEEVCQARVEHLQVSWSGDA